MLNNNKCIRVVIGLLLSISLSLLTINTSVAMMYPGEFGGGGYYIPPSSPGEDWSMPTSEGNSDPEPQEEVPSPEPTSLEITISGNDVLTDVGISVTEPIGGITVNEFHGQKSIDTFPVIENFFDATEEMFAEIDNDVGLSAWVKENSEVLGVAVAALIIGALAIEAPVIVAVGGIALLSIGCTPVEQQATPSQRPIIETETRPTSIPEPRGLAPTPTFSVPDPPETREGIYEWAKEYRPLFVKENGECNIEVRIMGSDGIKRKVGYQILRYWSENPKEYGLPTGKEYTAANGRPSQDFDDGTLQVFCKGEGRDWEHNWIPVDTEMSEPIATPIVALSATSTPGLTSIPVATPTPLFSYYSAPDSEIERDVFYNHLVPRRMGEHMSEIETGNAYIKLGGYEVNGPILVYWATGHAEECGFATGEEYTVDGRPGQDFDNGTIVLINGVASFTSGPTAKPENYLSITKNNTSFTTANGTHKIDGSDEFRQAVVGALQKIKLLAPEVLKYAGGIKEATGAMLDEMKAEGSFGVNISDKIWFVPDFASEEYRYIAHYLLIHEFSHIAGCNEEEAFTYMYQLALLRDNNLSLAEFIKDGAWRAYSIEIPTNGPFGTCPLLVDESSKIFDFYVGNDLISLNTDQFSNAYNTGLAMMLPDAAIQGKGSSEGIYLYP